MYSLTFMLFFLILEKCFVYLFRVAW